MNAPILHEGLSLADYTALKTIPGARTIALDPHSGRIYIPVADLAPAAEAGGKPDIIPGSLRILVAGTL